MGNGTEVVCGGGVRSRCAESVCGGGVSRLHQSQSDALRLAIAKVWFCTITNSSSAAPPARVSGGLLADDMGLGKTIQTLCILDHRSLVVVPTSVLSNWKNDTSHHLLLKIIIPLYTKNVYKFIF